MKLLIVYRCCDGEKYGPSNKGRPGWFNKIKCFKSVVNDFKNASHLIKFICVHDGDGGPFLDFLQHSNIGLDKINLCSNEKSLLYCLEKALKCLNDDKTFDAVYFVEDDYLHQPGWLKIMIEGLQKFKLITLYDHLDRYITGDDICKDHESISLTNSSHWRTAESTTCTWACTRELFDIIIPEAKIQLLKDRLIFRELYKKGIRLWTPIPGWSTHSNIHVLSPLVNWQIISDKI